MSDDNRIILAHEPDFQIGPMCVFPSTREVERDGAREVIEPRVMQVLVALYRAHGAVVSKDDLIHSCWEGRVVGDDAINRVVSRLRKLGEGAGSGVFEVETVTRVGCRLRLLDESAPASSALGPSAPRLSLSRRQLVIGGSVAVAGLGASGWWLANRSEMPTSLAAGLIQRGQQAVLYGTPEQVAVGISLLQRATEIEPDNAEAWGKLSMAYGAQAQQSAQRDYERLIDQAESAGRRALQLNPDNPEALVGRTLSRAPGDRVARHKALLALLARFPDHPAANRVAAFQLSQVGRVSDALPFLQKAVALEPYSPTDAHALATLLWSAKRLAEADQAMERAYDQWPRHYGVWFARYKYLTHTQRLAEARAMVDMIGQRPTGIPDANFNLLELELAALDTRTEAAIARARAAHLEAARTGIGFAQNAITFAAATGDADTLFRLADTFYLNRQQTASQQRYTREQGLYSPVQRRPVYFLFTPPFAPHWRDPRFAALMAELGLTAYWKATGSTPDYQRG